jgi:hypothetical protein
LFRLNDCFYIAVPTNSLNSTEAVNSDKALFVSAANVRKYGFEYEGGVRGDGPSQCMNEKDKYFERLREITSVWTAEKPFFVIGPRVSGEL